MLGGHRRNKEVLKTTGTPQPSKFPLSFTPQTHETPKENSRCLHGRFLPFIRHSPDVR